MSTAKALEYLELAKQELLASAPPPPSVTIDTPAALDRAVSLAVPGDVLILPATFVSPGPFLLTKAITLRGAGLPGTVARMTADVPLPRFLGGLTIPSDGGRLVGLEVRHTNPSTDIVTFAGANVVLDRVRILGDPMKGAKRGIGANHNGNALITRCYVDDCFQPSPGVDSQAICAWDMAPGLVIEDNFLRAGSETIMLGGADSSSLARMPADVVIRSNTITARPEWQGQPIGVKTRLELKACRRVLIEDNVIEHCWIQGQAGYLVSFTVKNQDGNAPWSTIEDVTFQDNICRYGPAALNILSTDYAHPSGRLARVIIQRNHFTDLNSPLSAQESHKLMQIGEGASDLTIDANTFAGGFIGSQVYLTGTSKHERLTVTNNTWPTSLYGVFGSDSAFGQAWATHVTSGTLRGNVEVG